MRINRGFSLVELMVGLAIGLFLLAGTIMVFSETRKQYRAIDEIARLQENARYALSTLEVDARMANFWGQHNRADFIDNAADPGDSLEGSITTATGIINQCGDSTGSNWGVDLRNYVDGSDGTYSLNAGGGCPPGPLVGGVASTVVAGSDVLTVRRATTNTIDPAAAPNLIKIQSSRSRGTLFLGTALPSGYLPPLSDTRGLMTASYYVSTNSDAAAGLPSLRRKRLSIDPDGNTAVLDEEVTAGIEDLQVEVGLDTNGDTLPELFTTLDDINSSDAVVAIRFWILARAEQPDFSFTSGTTYDYAGRPAYTPADNFRRTLLVKTIQLRNTRR
jgi:type IV pilus assembly protein PilW